LELFVKKFVTTNLQIKNAKHAALLASKLQRSRSMPHVNPRKLMLLNPGHSNQEPIQINVTSRVGHFSYQMKEDSGIDSSHHSEHVDGMGIQGDFASGGSGMLASEPPSMVEPMVIDEVVEVANAVILMASKNGKPIVINAIDDKKLKELRTLKQHYYPEGGWGWLITLITLLVQMISVGFPVALAMFVLDLPLQPALNRKMEAEIREHAGRIFFDMFLTLGLTFSF
jgi:hypothetical protein